MKRPDRSALIIAPLSADLRVLRHILAQHGYQVIAPDLMAPGVTWIDALNDILRRVDLVVGVFEGKMPSAAVAFDLGLAAAAAVDVLVVASPECDLPSAFSSFFVIRGTVTSEDALAFFFANASFQKAKPRLHSRATFPALADRVDEYMQRAEAASGQALEDLVWSIFSDAGFDAKSAHRVGEREIDLAVWSDSLAPYLDNPLLVEVKDELSEIGLARSLAQVTNIAQAAGVRWALLIYVRGPAPEVVAQHANQASRVLVVSLTHLLESLRRTSLFDVLRALRNRKVHGVEG